MPGKPETKETPVEVIPAEPQKKPDTIVELDATTGKPVETATRAETVSPEEFKKLTARMEFQARQFEKSQREWSERLAQLSTPQPTKSPVEKPEADGYGFNKEELTQLGQSDWTKPVKMMAEKIAEKKAEEKFKALMAEHQKQQQEQFNQQSYLQTLEKQKAWVAAKDPSLMDETSESFKGYWATWNKMLAEDQSLMKNPYAPKLVYNEWKDSSEVKDTVEKPDPEKERLKRVAAGVSPQGRPSSNPKTIKLTQDEVDFCKAKGISPAMYASMKEANFKEGVSA